MKKIYLFLLMCMFSLVSFAKGTGTGEYRVDAIDYQWNTNVSVNPGTTWYFVDITALDTIEHPAMSLSIINAASADVNVTAVVYVYNGTKKVTEESRNYVIAQGSYKELNTSMISLVKGSGYDVFVRLTCDADIQFETTLAENQGAVENTCANAEEFDWSAGNEQEADTSVWYVVDLAQAKAQGKDIELTILNQGTANARIDAFMSYTCPTSGVTSLSRTLGAGAALSKTIFYSAYSSLGDELYVMVTSTQQLFISAELKTPNVESTDACQSAVPFDLTDGNLQAAGSDVWYAVDMDALRAESKVPSITVENKGATTATVTFELSFDCPTIGELQSRTIQIAAGNTYEKTVGRDLINSVDASIHTVYVRVVSSQALFIGASFDEANAGESCANPVRFNWVNGNKQAAGSTVWYMVDLSGINDEAVLLSLINNASSAATVDVAIAFDCPVSTTTDQTTTLAALQTRSRTLPNAFVKAVNNDYLYIQVTTNQTITIKAELVAETSETSDCDLATATEYDWASLITIAEGTKWYYVSLDTLRNTFLAPEVVIKNLGSASATITAELAFECPTSDPMMTETRVIGAGQEVSKLLERSVIDNYAGAYEYAYVRLTTTEDLLFSAKLKDPNSGEDCAHAIHFDWENGHVQEADTVWYIVDLTPSNSKSVTLNIENLASTAEEVFADLYFACDGELVYNTACTLSGHDVLTKDLGTLLTGSFVPDSVFVRLTTGTLTRLSASLSDVAGEPITACAEAMDLLPNIYYHLGANKDQWYAIDVKDLQENTSGNAELAINNHGGDNNLKMELVWACPTAELPTTKNLTLAAGEFYEKETTRELINNIDAEVAYLHILTEDSITFRYVITDLRGASCIEAIPFNWNETNIHPAENGNFHPMDSTLWYRVNIDTLRVDSTQDLVLHLENLENATVNLGVEIWGSCDVIDSLASSTYTMEPLESKERIISNALVSRISYADLFVRLSSTNGDVHVWTSLTESVIDTTWVDPIDTVLCDGAEFVYFDSVYTESVDTVLYYTIEYNPTSTTIADSIYTFNVHFLQDPVLPTALTNIPAVVCGKAISVSNEVLAEIADSVAAQSYVAEIDSIWWEKGVWSDRYQTYTDFQALTDELLPLFTDSVALRYGVLTTCETSTYSETFVLEVTGPCLEEIIPVNDTVCVGTEYIPGHILTEALTEWVDTIYFYNADSTQLGDSIISYSIYTFSIQLPEEVVSLPTLQAGKAVDVEEATADLLTQIADESVLAAPVDTVIWMVYAPDSAAFVPAANYLTSTLTDSVRLQYTVITECEDTLTAELKIGAEEPLVVTHNMPSSICYGDSILGRLGESVILFADSTWNDTVRNVNYAVDQRVDSVYSYVITVAPLALGYDTMAICPGDTATFLGRQYTIAGNYVDTISTTTGCDSIVTLTLVVNPVLYDTVPAEICFGDSIEFFGQFYFEAGLYSDTTSSVLTGCDSIVTLDLKINPILYDTIDVTICANETFEFLGNMYNLAGQYTDTTASMVTGCDSIVTLRLTVNPLLYDTIEAVVCSGDSIEFLGHYYSAVGTYTDTTSSVVTGCDSIVTLILHSQYNVRKKFNVTICPSEAADFHGNNVTASGTYYEYLKTSEGCDSTNIYNVTLLDQIVIPTLTATPHIYCGLSIDTKEATAELEAAFAGLNPKKSVTAEGIAWLYQNGTEWVDASTVSGITNDGKLHSLRCAVYTSCGDTILSDVLEVSVEMPTADEITEYDNLAASNKYDNWLLMINLNALNEKGFNPSEEEVFWYKVVDDVDVIGADGGNDVFVGKGYYYTLTEALSGDYYALVVLNGQDADACSATLRTVVLTCAPVSAISVAPTSLRPGETITISNLDAEADYVISVFDTKGIRIADYNVSGMTSYQFETEGAAGYYLLKVNSEDSVNSFKYILK